MAKVLILGLGNPGRKFENTRHNAGFLALEYLQRKWDFPEFKEKKKNFAELSKRNFERIQIVLGKPLTFMNDSGKAAKLIVKDLRVKNLIVVHDDADLPFGKIKISYGAGSAGHKGVGSIIEALGTKNFYRVRIGIRPPGNTQKAETFVLKNFSKQEKQKLQSILEQVCKLLEGKLRHFVPFNAPF